MTDQKKQDDEGFVQLDLITGAVGLVSGLLPGQGGEEHLVKAVRHTAKFLNARYEAVDQAIDTDG